MWQNIIVGIIILLCILYVGRRFIRQAQGRSGCGCSCAGCPTSSEPGDNGPEGGCGPEGRS